MIDQRRGFHTSDPAIRQKVKHGDVVALSGAEGYYRVKYAGEVTQFWPITKAEAMEEQAMLNGIAAALNNHRNDTIVQAFERHGKG